MVLKNKPVGSERNQRDPKKAAAIQERLFGGQKWTQVTNHAGARIVAAGSPAGKDVRSMLRWMLHRKAPDIEMPRKRLSRQRISRRKEAL